jgi:hypothetical protein
MRRSNPAGTTRSPSRGYARRRESTPAGASPRPFTVWGHFAGGGVNDVDTAYIDGVLKELLAG